MAPVILTLNAGSSTLKLALYKGADESILRGLVEGVGGVSPNPRKFRQPPRVLRSRLKVFRKHNNINIL